MPPMWENQRWRRKEVIKLEDNDYKTRRLEDNDGDEPPMWDNRISNKRGNKTRRLEDNDDDKPPMGDNEIPNKRGNKT